MGLKEKCGDVVSKDDERSSEAKKILSSETELRWTKKPNEYLKDYYERGRVVD